MYLSFKNISLKQTRKQTYSLPLEAGSQSREELVRICIHRGHSHGRPGDTPTHRLLAVTGCQKLPKPLLPFVHWTPAALMPGSWDK